MSDVQVQVKLTQEQYEKVAGYVTRTPRNGNSGGYVEGSFRVNYDINSGFSGKSWYTDNPGSPFCGFSSEEIQEAQEYFRRWGHLNEYFSAWPGNGSTPEQRAAFVIFMYEDDCANYLG